MKKYTTLIIIWLAVCGSLLGVEFNWYSQGDNRWDSDRLGNSRSTIGSSGCVLSCLSMLLNAEASNPRITPDKLNSWLRNNGGFAGNLMRWQVPGQIDGNGGGLELQSQISKANDWEYLSSELEKGNKVIVKVNKRSSHWVLVIKRDGPYNCASSYIINDPAPSNYTQRNLGYYGGFRAARSYSGNWLDDQAFDLISKINVIPTSEDEAFIYQLGKLPIPANVFVELENKLRVDITGYFMLGLFDQNSKLSRIVDYEYASIGPEQNLDLIYEMADVTPLNNQDYELRIIYSKYFNSVPSMNESIALPNPGLVNYTNSGTESSPVEP